MAEYQAVSRNLMHASIKTTDEIYADIEISEREKIFGKFFRASNARKNRPDGTGLGLFMAAKVINAQGGEILFSSKENVGSIFGFRIPIQQEQ